MAADKIHKTLYFHATKRNIIKFNVFYGNLLWHTMDDDDDDGGSGNGNVNGGILSSTERRNRLRVIG